MAALTPGSSAPDFTLPDADGRPHPLDELLAEGPALLVFFKVTCPTCRLAFPYIEKLHQAYGDHVRFAGVAQDPPAEATAFARENGNAAFAILSEKPPYATSEAYGLTNVPTLFAVAPDRRIAFSAVGFSKQAFRDLSALLADWADRLIVDLFPTGDAAPDLKPG